MFVCEHGAAKSVVAAAWLRRLADDAGLPLDAVACGTDPSPEVSPHAMAGLAGDGLAPAPGRPRPLDRGELRRAWRVVRFGPELSLPTPSTTPVETWEVPAVSDGYDAARDAIVKRLERLLSVASRRRAGSPRP